MSKQGTKPRASEPVRPASASAASQQPPIQRKASGPAGGPNSGKGNKFYAGPTVPKPSESVAAKVDAAKSKAQQVSQRSVSAAKAHGKRAVRTVKRHPFSFISLISALPVLLLFSLTSTILCPPSSTPPSWLSTHTSSLLGLGYSPSTSPLRQTLCAPAYAYHDAVLSPYIYPALDRAQARAQAHPIYTESVLPLYSRLSAGVSALERPLRPVVLRIQKGARKAYLTFVAPRVRYLQAKAGVLAAPYVARVKAVYETHAAKHVATGQKYAVAGVQGARKSYDAASTHPVTRQAGKWARTGYRESVRRGTATYVWTKPRVVAASNEVQRRWREDVLPRVIRGARWTLERLDKGTAVARGHIAAQYNTHLDPHLGPHIAKARKAAAPYIARFIKSVYNPYLRKHAEYYFPSLVAAVQEKPKSFWQIVADFLPSPGLHAAEQKGKMYEEVKGRKDGKASATASKAVKAATSTAAKAASSASKVADKVKKETQSVKSAAKSVTAAVKDAAPSAGAAKGKEGKMTRDEMERSLEHLRKRVQLAGQAGHKAVVQAIVDTHETFLRETVPRMQDTNRGELQRDVDYVLGGLDKLYSSSTTLRADQVAQSGAQGEERIQKKYSQIRARGKEVGRVLGDQAKPGVRDAEEAVDAALGKDAQTLAEKMAWVDDVSEKDWAKFNGLKKSADEYKSTYNALREGKQTDKAITKVQSKLSAAVNELSTELDDVYEGFRQQVRVLQKGALQKVSAREMVQASSASVSSASSVSHTAKGDRATVLPIPDAAGVAAGAGDVIGKGKEQVMDALSQLLSSAARGETQTGLAADVAASAASKVHDVTRSAMRAAGITPSPENLRESLASAAKAASQVVHDATRSVQSAVGASPAPEGVAESAASVVGAAGAGAAGATDAVKAALGDLHAVTEGIKARAAPVAGAGAGAGVAEAGAVGQGVVEAAKSVMSDVQGQAASLVHEASASVHSATRAASRAAGATPSPEAVQEYAEAVLGKVEEVGERVGEAVRGVVGRDEL